MMAADSSNVNDHIQQRLNENNFLILKILENQKSGTLSECARPIPLETSVLSAFDSTEKLQHRYGKNQAKLHRNLMYLSAIADLQTKLPAMHSQYATGGGILQPGLHYLQHQQAQKMTPQSHMSALSYMLNGAQPYPMLQQQALHGQLGMSPGGSSRLMLQGVPHTGGGSGGLGGGRFLDFHPGNPGDGLQCGARGLAGGSKQDIGSKIVAAEGLGGSDGVETLYLKSAEEGN